MRRKLDQYITKGLAHENFTCLVLNLTCFFFKALEALTSFHETNGKKMQLGFIALCLLSPRRFSLHSSQFHNYSTYLYSVQFYKYYVHLWEDY